MMTTMTGAVLPPETPMADITGTDRIASPPRSKWSRRKFHNDASWIATAFFLGTLGILSLLFGEHHHDLAGEDLSRRQLEDVDYSDYSCNKLFDETVTGTEAQCTFARTCNDGEGVFAPFVFCHATFSPSTWCWILSPILTLWLVILFRMLGSTAEDFFSPSLEMFSVKMGLPPRFAGVSLLALGNGAADVSATVNAITADAQNGYQLSLGALTGAAMFVGAVVMGVVVVVADSVPCRGALVRDVTALLLTVVVVFSELSSGKIGPRAISMFCSMYLLFVAIVLVADIYHRAVVIPRIQREALERERERQILEGERVTEHAGHALNDLATSSTALNELEGQATRRARPSVFDSILVSLSNYGPDSTGQNGPRPGGWGVESDDIMHERPIVLHGTNGLLSDAHHQHIHPREPLPLHRTSHTEPNGDEDATPYTQMLDQGTMFCTEEGTLGLNAANWKGAWEDGMEELALHFISVWRDIWDNEDNSVLDQILQVCEMPFVVARKLSIPIPCEGYYCRALVALSLFLSPLWFGVYIWNEYDTNIFAHISVALAVSFVLGALILRFAPGGEGNMALFVSGPIALYGFVIAATWIDFIADHLVNLLDFLGIICRIPGSIMGLTILAWGNSMGDLSANVTMARKGLANMAITACFAGPVFNILIGLGLGFSTLSAKTGEAEKEVTLSPSVLTGFLFIVINTLMVIVMGVFITKGVIPKQYGYVAGGLYLVYVVTSLVLQFSGDQ